MKLIAELQKQISGMGRLKYAWMTSFNADIEFIETYILPATLGVNPPRSRLEYEQLQQELTTQDIDFRVFCDPRFIETNRVKRTCIPVHEVRPARTSPDFSDRSLFHPKVIYLEDIHRKRVIGAGSANLTVSGWGRNLEAFTFFEIGSSANYQKIRAFFERLCTAADIACMLEPRPRFKSQSENWRFVHSYQDDTFPKQLLGGVTDADLAVWSPYLPRDLATFVDSLQTAAGAEQLRVHLVPDRIEGKYFRTEWSTELAQMLADGRLTAYGNSAPRHPQTELCHAKLWKVADKLAIGSWNFTGPGANALRDANGGWHPDNNVEAGFIIDDVNAWRDTCGSALDFGADDCASQDLLEEESLQVDALPPFALHVTFDWHEEAYGFEGKWLGGPVRDGYSIQLPGVGTRVQLAWNGRLLPCAPGSLTVDERALLRDRVYTVFHGVKQVHQGLVLEKNVRSRRAQAFDSLKDLLEALVQGEDPRSKPDLKYRTVIDDDPLGLPVVPADTPIIPHDDAPDAASVSYFRLFHAMHMYREKLSKLERLEQLDSQVFSWPGCLLELVEKLAGELRTPARAMFNWFLANELVSLCAYARKRRGSLVRGLSEREPGYVPVPVGRWRKLGVVVPRVPAGVHAGYFNLIREQCSYA